MQVFLDHTLLILYREMRRNLLHLNVVPNGDPPTNSRTDTSQESSHRSVKRYVTGTAIRPPERFTY